MKRLLSLLFLALICSLNCDARIGDTPAEVVKRLGKPKSQQIASNGLPTQMDYDIPDLGPVRYVFGNRSSRGYGAYRIIVKPKDRLNPSTAAKLAKQLAHGMDYKQGRLDKQSMKEVYLVSNNDALEAYYDGTIMEISYKNGNDKLRERQGLKPIQGKIICKIDDRAVDLEKKLGEPKENTNKLDNYRQPITRYTARWSYTIDGIGDVRYDIKLGNTCLITVTPTDKLPKDKVKDLIVTFCRIVPGTLKESKLPDHRPEEIYFRCASFNRLERDPFAVEAYYDGDTLTIGKTGEKPELLERTQSKSSGRKKIGIEAL